jgi:integrase
MDEPLPRGQQRQTLGDSQPAGQAGRNLPRRQRRRTLSDSQLAALPVKPKRYTTPIPQCHGLHLRISPSGVRTYVAVARSATSHKPIWATLGRADLMGVDEAASAARAAIKRIKDGLPPFEAPPPAPVVPDSYEDIAKKWLKRHVEAKGLRSAREVERVVRRQILPAWGRRPFVDIRRSDVAKLLDDIEDNSGKRSADIALAVIRGIANWYASRDDNYVAPIAKGMARQDKKQGEGRRDRVLSDDELRRVWAAAGEAGAFGALVKTLLLTAQRRAAVLGMRWTDIDSNGVWTLPVEKRAKNNIGKVRLPRVALDVIAAQPRLNNYVFASTRDTGRALRSFSRTKRRFDEACGVTNWCLHDLRRCARSLLTRCGVQYETGEATLGHTLKGVASHYVVISEDQKSAALQRLADLISRIVEGDDAKVVPFASNKAQPS